LCSYKHNSVGPIGVNVVVGRLGVLVDWHQRNGALVVLVAVCAASAVALELAYGLRESRLW